MIRRVERDAKMGKDLRDARDQNPELRRIDPRTLFQPESNGPRRLKLHGHLAIRAEGPHYCVIVQVELVGEPSHLAKGRSNIGRRGNRDIRGASHERLKDSVFVAVVQDQERPEQSEVRVEWLAPVEVCPVPPWNALQVGLGHGVESLYGFVDRELRSLPAWNVGVEVGELVDQVVKGRPEILERVRRDQRDVARRLGKGANPDRVLWGVEVVLGVHEVGLRLKEGCDLGIYLFDVLISPLDRIQGNA